MPSTVIAAIDYNVEQLCLRITYQSGLVYEYLKVPEPVYRQMLMYRSKGAFLNQNIKGKFAFRKLGKDLSQAKDGKPEQPSS